MDIKNQALEIKSRIDELKNEQLKLQRQLNELQKEVMPKPKYGNRKIKIECNARNWKGMDLGEVIRITDHLINEHEKKEHMSIFSSINGDWKEGRHSVGYYRNEYGILQHEGGGYVMLNDGIPCSDEEWEDIKAGNFPDKFLNKGLID